MENDGWELIPYHMQGAMRNWIERGWEPGSFLKAVLENDLFSAVSRADDVNRNRLMDYVRFLYNYAPADCYGSPENVRQWKKRFVEK